VVATAELDQSVDVEGVGGLEGAVYDPKTRRGRAAHVKTPRLCGKITIFLSGKLISVGTKSPEEALKDLGMTVEILATSGFIEPTKVSAKVRNIVAVLNLGFSIDLERLADREGSIYEPEQFPALMMKNTSPRATFLIFASGKVVIVGCRSIEELKQAAEIVQEITRALG